MLRASLRQRICAADRALRALGVSARLRTRAQRHATSSRATGSSSFMNYSECYHCPLVHPQLDKLSPSDSGRNDLSEGPFLGGYSEMRQPGTSLTMSGHSSRPPLGTVSGADLDRVYYYTIFPSLHVEPASATTSWCITSSRWPPIAPSVICAWLFDPATMRGAGLRSERRGRVLGSHEPARLARQRAYAARHELARVFARDRTPTPKDC